MLVPLECISKDNHLITNEKSPKKGQTVLRLNFLDGDKKHFCRAFFSMDVEMGEKIEPGQMRFVGVTSQNTINGVVYIKGELKPLDFKV